MAKHKAQLVDEIPVTKNKRKNSNGFLICDKATFAKEGVLFYKDYELPYSLVKELGFPDVVRVFRSIDSLTENIVDFDGLPLTDGHLFEPITVKDKSTVAGVTSNIKTSKKAVTGKLTIFDINCVFDIEQGDKSELSLGYDTKLTVKAGTFDNQDYDVVSTEIKPNHVALTHNGRCGPDCAIVDSTCDCQTCINKRSKSTTTTTKGNTTMNKETIAISVADQVVHVADESVKPINELVQQLADANKRIDTLTGELDTAKAELKDTKDKYTAEKILVMVNDAATIRGVIVEKAKSFIKDDLSALDNLAIMRKVLASKGVEGIAEKTENYVQGAFDSLTIPNTDTSTNTNNNGLTFVSDNQDVKDGAVSSDGMTVMIDGKPMDRVEAARKGFLNQANKTAA